MKLDTSLHAETPEGIDILLRPAGLAARSLAFTIDLMIRFGLWIVAAIVLQFLGGIGTGAWLVATFVLVWIYPIVFELLPGAATPGKRAMGLQVVMDDGLPITPAASATRNLLIMVDLLPAGFALGILCMLLRRDFKRVGDIVSGALVVHCSQVRLSRALPEATPMAPRVPLQRPQQVAILRLAGRAGRLTPERLDELAALAEGVLPPPDLAPGGVSPPPVRPGPRLVAVAQWLAGQR